MRPASGWYVSVVFFFTYSLKLGWALRCYTCETTEHGELCDDGFTEDGSDFLGECENEEAICFKTVSTIFDARSQKDYRVTGRGCMETEKDDGCDMAETISSGTYTSCYCRSEKCNGAAHQLPPLTTLLVAAALALGLWKHAY